MKIKETKEMQKKVNKAFKYLRKLPICITGWAYNDNGAAGQQTKVKKYMNGEFLAEGEASSFGADSIDIAISLTRGKVNELIRDNKNVFVRMLPEVFVDDDGRYYIYTRIAAFN